MTFVFFQNVIFRNFTKKNMSLMIYLFFFFVKNNNNFNVIVSDDLAYIWTSGRLCNFKGCDRDDLQPVQVNGWFWSGSGVKMAPTNSTPPGWSYQPWSGKEKSIKKGKLFFREINIKSTLFVFFLFLAVVFGFFLIKNN